MTGAFRGEMVFGKCRKTLEIGERKKPFEEKQAPLAKMEGLQLKGDPEQRRSGWSSAENKAARFECGNTDRSKAQCQIWIQDPKGRKAGKRRKTTKGGRKRKEEIGSVCLFG